MSTSSLAIIYKILIVTICFTNGFHSGHVRGQTSQFPETEKLIEEALSFKYKDWEKALELIDRAWTISKDIQDPLLQLKVLEARTLIALDGSPMEEAIKFNQEALAFYNSHNLDEPFIKASLLFNSSIVLKRAGRHDKALEYLNEVRDIYEDHDPYSNWSVYSQFGEIYQVLGRYEEAGKFLRQSLDIVKEGGKRMDYGYQLIRNILFCQNVKDYDCYSNLMAEYQDFKGGTVNWYETDYHLELIRNDASNDLEHIKELKKQLDAHIRQKNLALAAEAAYQISLIYAALNDLINATKYGEQALSIYKGKKSAGAKAGFHKNLAELYERRRDYQKAFIHHKEYKLYADSLSTLQVQANLNEVQTKYETEKKEQEIVLLSAQNELKDERIQKARRNVIFSLLGILILTGFAFVMYQSRQKISRLNSVLEDQKKALSKSLTEKEFLLKEIHHRVKNNLQVISSLLKLQSKSINDKKARLALDEGRTRVRSMAIIHQNLYQKDNLAGISMIEYLTQLVSELSDTYQLEKDRIDLQLQVDDIHLDVDSAVPVGLIVNELVSNSLKYGFPDGSKGIIAIAFNFEGEFLKLKVVDNGIGFDHKDISKESFGHKLVASFAERLQADYHLDGSQGTTASFLIRDFKLAA